MTTRSGDAYARVTDLLSAIDHAVKDDNPNPSEEAEAVLSAIAALTGALHSYPLLAGGIETEIVQMAERVGLDEDGQPFNEVG